jgi:hypothetical protein
MKLLPKKCGLPTWNGSLAAATKETTRENNAHVALEMIMNFIVFGSAKVFFSQAV